MGLIATDEPAAAGVYAECLECGNYTPAKVDGQNQLDVNECVSCASDCLTPVTMTTCPNPEVCADDSHDWGVDMHVSELTQ